MSIRKFHSKRKQQRTGDGTRYQAIVRVGGKQKKATFDSEAEAQLWELEVKTGRRCLAPVEQRSELTFVELASLWWEQYALQEMGASTRSSRAGFLKREVDPEFGALPCSEITTQHVMQWDVEIKQRMSNGIPQRLLKQIFNWGNRHELISCDPTKLLQLQNGKNDSWTYFSIEERDQFLASERGEVDYPMWLFGFFMGLRVGEIVVLEKSKIDLHRNLLEVDQRFCRTSLQILRGTKGSKEGKIKRRTLPIPTPLQPYCVQLVNQPGQYLFTARSLDRPMHPSTFTYRFNQALERAEARKIRVHDIRHTFASIYMMQAGANIYHLRDWMGHSNLKQTERYAHLNPEILRESADLVVGSGFEVLQAVASE